MDLLTNVKKIPKGFSSLAVVEQQFDRLFIRVNGEPQSPDSRLVSMVALEKSAVPRYYLLSSVARDFDKAIGCENDGVVGDAVPRQPGSIQCKLLSNGRLPRIGQTKTVA